jgi:hypothetical protein
MNGVIKQEKRMNGVDEIILYIITNGFDKGSHRRQDKSEGRLLSPKYLTN